MSNKLDIVFLGGNDAGTRVYEWLCDREDVFVHALLTRESQLALIESVKPDYVISCGFRHVVPESILNVPAEGCLNLHASYLPYNRGANPNVWSIVDRTPAGATLHVMDANIDTGDIVARDRVETDFSDTGRDLYERLEDAQVELFKRVWPAIVTGETTVEGQDEGKGTYHTSDEFSDLCELDPQEEIQVKPFLNRLRALTFPPYDNAEIEIDGVSYNVEITITEA